LSRIDAYASSDCVLGLPAYHTCASCPFTASDDLRIEIIFFEITKDPEYYRTVPKLLLDPDPLLFLRTLK
jgi:hypothetical protein